MKRILLVPSDQLPIPPTKGGAPQDLIWNGLIEPNETSDEPIRFSVLSVYDEEAEKLSRRCKKTDFIYFKYPLLPRFLDFFMILAIKMLREERFNRFAFFFRNIWHRKYLKKILKKNNFDEIVFQNNGDALKVFKNKAIFKKYKGHYWYHAHAAIARIKGSKKPHENFSGIICVSNYIAESFKSIPDYKCPKTYVLMNYVDHEMFYPKEKNRELQKKYGLSDSDFVVMFSGRMVAEKGPDKLILAFKEVLKEKPDSKLLIVGSIYIKSNFVTSFEEKVKKLAEELGDKVVFTGYVDHWDMADIYSLADVVCLPSVWQEPAGLTMLESMACGKPLITTKSGGIPEYVGDSAVILPLDDDLIKNIASNIIRLQNHPEERKRLGNAAHERSLIFTKEEFYKMFLDVVVGDKKGD